MRTAHSLRRCLCAGLLLCVSPASLRAQRAALTGTLTVDHVASHGDTLVVRVSTQMTPGWHIGATRPGILGVPTTLTWTLPAAWRVASVAWPAPMRVVIGRDTVYEYRGSLTIDAKLLESQTLRRGTIAASMSYGICKEVCIQGWLTLRTDVR